MKREDLFRAMDGIPDELLLRSEEEAGKVVDFNRRRRIPLMLLSSAAMGIAAGFLFMAVAQPMLSGRRTAGSSTIASVQEEQAETPSLVASAEEEMQAEANMAVPQAEAAAETFDSAAAEEAVPEETLVKETAEAETGAEEEAPAKTSADLLGDKREDYVKVEYISAEDKENGGTPKEPEYSEEGEEALSRAFSEGVAQVSLFGVQQTPLYYFYLTKSNGEQEEVVVYEGGYATISSMSGVCVKMPADVMTELESFLSQ